MAKYKFLPVQRLLTAGVDVLVCDTDTVWMKNPMPYFKETPEPDILTSTDVLRQLPLKEQLQSTLNIGIMVFRSRPPSIQCAHRDTTTPTDIPRASLASVVPSLIPPFPPR